MNWNNELANNRRSATPEETLMLLRNSQELVKLRVSVARIAQVVGVSLAPVGLPAGMPYEVLAKTAATRDRGWNLLCAHIVDMVERDFSAKFETPKC